VQRGGGGRELGGKKFPLQRKDHKKYFDLQQSEKRHSLGEAGPQLSVRSRRREEGELERDGCTERWVDAPSVMRKEKTISR